VRIHPTEDRLELEPAAPSREARSKAAWAGNITKKESDLQGEKIDAHGGLSAEIRGTSLRRKKNERQRIVTMEKPKLFY
jgi:hypothetical protein